MARLSLVRALCGASVLSACNLPNPFDRDESEDVDVVGVSNPPIEPWDAGVVAPFDLDAALAAYDAGTCSFEGALVPPGSFDAGACKLCMCWPANGVHCFDLRCPATCTYQGEELAEYESVQDGCRTCTCGSDGTMLCDELLCSGCTLGDRTFEHTRTLTCSDGCNQCTCTSNDAWLRTRETCPALRELAVCAPETLRRDLRVNVLYLERDALGLSVANGCPSHTYELCTDSALTPSELAVNGARARVWLVDTMRDTPCDAPGASERVFDVSTLAPMLRSQLNVDQGPVTLVLESGAPSEYEPYWVPAP